MQIEVNGVKAHQAGRSDAENGVEVCTVVVHLSACVVNDLACGLDVRFKETQRVGVGDHHGCGGFVRHGGERIQIHSSVGQTWNFHDFKT